MVALAPLKPRTERSCCSSSTPSGKVAQPAGRPQQTITMILPLPPLVTQPRRPRQSATWCSTSDSSPIPSATGFRRRDIKPRTRGLNDAQKRQTEQLYADVLLTQKITDRFDVADDTVLRYLHNIGTSSQVRLGRPSFVSP